MEIASYISELLYSHNCVIIPGFGGFVASYRPSVADTKKHVYYPPSKFIAFNENLQTNDGLLAHHISLKRHVPYEEALDFIKAFAQNLKEQLASRRKVAIADIGSFSLVKDRLVFEPSQNNFLANSFGLSPVQATPVKRLQTIERAQRELTNEGHKNPVRRIRTAAAAIVILFLAASGILYWQLNKENSQANESSLNPFSDTFDARVNPEVETESLAAPKDTIVFRSQINKPAKVVKTPEPVDASDPAYHIIGGAFQQGENAEKYIQELKKKGIDAFLLPKQKDELYRVSLGRFDDKTTAVTRLQHIKNHINNEAWILTL